MSDNRLPDFDFVISEILLAHECTYPQNALYDGYQTGRMSSGIVYAQQGGAKYKGPEKTLRANAGDVVFLPAASAYAVQAQEDAFHHFTVNFHLSKTRSQNAVSQILNSRGIHVLETKNEPQFRNWFEKITGVWYDKKSGYQLLCKAYLYEMLHGFFSEYIGFTLNKNDLDRILPAKRYLDENYTKNIPAKTLSEMCGVSQTHFRRLFKELYGTSPVDYQINMRLLKAKDLLLFKVYSVREVAEMTGFFDANYFSRVFKERVGISPLKFKIMY